MQTVPIPKDTTAAATSNSQNKKPTCLVIFTGGILGLEPDEKTGVLVPSKIPLEKKLRGFAGMVALYCPAYCAFLKSMVLCVLVRI